MIHNRSVPVDTVLPHIEYRNLEDAIAWLCATLGFTEHYRYGDPVSGAQLYLGKAYVMVNNASSGAPRNQVLTVFLDGVDAHYQRTQSTGAKIVEELHETIYGERQYAVEDPDGHRWLFSQHARDISPDEWGARLAQPKI